MIFAQTGLAAGVWTRAELEARQLRDSFAQARALLSLSKASWQMSRLDTARGFGERALTIINERGMRAEVSEANRVLGLVALDQSRTDDALTLFQRALDAARAEGDHADEAKAAGNMGLAHAYMGEYERARIAHRQARMAGRALGDPELEGKGLTNEAMVDIWEGDARPAIARLDTARALYRRPTS